MLKFATGNASMREFIQLSKNVANMTLLSIFSKRGGDVGCCGRATPAHNIPRPDLLRRYIVKVQAQCVPWSSLIKSFETEP